MKANTILIFVVVAVILILLVWQAPAIKASVAKGGMPPNVVPPKNNTTFTAPANIGINPSSGGLNSTSPGTKTGTNNASTSITAAAIAAAGSALPGIIDLFGSGGSGASSISDNGFSDISGTTAPDSNPVDTSNAGADAGVITDNSGVVDNTSTNVGTIDATGTSDYSSYSDYSTTAFDSTNLTGDILNEDPNNA